jgi:hypothetical protein
VSRVLGLDCFGGQLIVAAEVRQETTRMLSQLLGGSREPWKDDQNETSSTFIPPAVQPADTEEHTDTNSQTHTLDATQRGFVVWRRKQTARKASAKGLQNSENVAQEESTMELQSSVAAAPNIKLDKLQALVNEMKEVKRKLN